MKKRLFCLLLSLLMLVTVCPVAALAETLTEEPAATAAPAEGEPAPAAPAKDEPEPEPEPAAPAEEEPDPEPEPAAPAEEEPEPDPVPAAPAKEEPEPDPNAGSNDPADPADPVDPAEPETVSVTLTVVFEDDGASPRPGSVKAELRPAGAADQAVTVTISVESEWTYTVTGLKAGEYTVEAEEVEGYALTVSGDAKAGFVLTYAREAAEPVEEPVEEPQEPAEEPIEEPQEPEEPAEEPALRSQTVSDEEGLVAVTGLLPEGVAVTARPLTEEEIAALGLEGCTVHAAYDITLWLDGEEYQPEGAVSVQISELALPEDAEVRHIETDDEGNPVDSETLTPTLTEEGVSFTTGGFSPFLIVTPQGTDGEAGAGTAAGQITMTGSWPPAGDTYVMAATQGRSYEVNYRRESPQDVVLVVECLQYGSTFAVMPNSNGSDNILDVVPLQDSNPYQFALRVKNFSGDMTLTFTFETKHSAMSNAQAAYLIDHYNDADFYARLSCTEYTLEIDDSLSDAQKKALLKTVLTAGDPTGAESELWKGKPYCDTTDTDEAKIITQTHAYKTAVSPVSTAEASWTNWMFDKLGVGSGGDGNNAFFNADWRDGAVRYKMPRAYGYYDLTKENEEDRVTEYGCVMEIVSLRFYVPSEKLILYTISKTPDRNTRSSANSLLLGDFTKLWSDWNPGSMVTETDDEGHITGYYYEVKPKNGARWFNTDVTNVVGDFYGGLVLTWHLANQADPLNKNTLYGVTKDTVVTYKLPGDTASRTRTFTGSQIQTYDIMEGNMVHFYGGNNRSWEFGEDSAHNVIVGSIHRNEYLLGANNRATMSGANMMHYTPKNCGSFNQTITFPYQIQPLKLYLNECWPYVLNANVLEAELASISYTDFNNNTIYVDDDVIDSINDIIAIKDTGGWQNEFTRNLWSVTLSNDVHIKTLNISWSRFACDYQWDWQNKAQLSQITFDYKVNDWADEEEESRLDLTKAQNRWVQVQYQETYGNSADVYPSEADQVYLASWLSGERKSMGKKEPYAWFRLIPDACPDLYGEGPWQDPDQNRPLYIDGGSNIIGKVGFYVGRYGERKDTILNPVIDLRMVEANSSQSGHAWSRISVLDGIDASDALFFLNGSFIAGEKLFNAKSEENKGWTFTYDVYNADTKENYRKTYTVKQEDVGTRLQLLAADEYFTSLSLSYQGNADLSHTDENDTDTYKWLMLDIGFRRLTKDPRDGDPIHVHDDYQQAVLTMTGDVCFEDCTCSAHTHCSDLTHESHANTKNKQTLKHVNTGWYMNQKTLRVRLFSTRKASWQVSGTLQTTAIQVKNQGDSTSAVFRVQEMQQSNGPRNDTREDIWISPNGADAFVTSSGASFPYGEIHEAVYIELTDPEFDIDLSATSFRGYRANSASVVAEKVKVDGKTFLKLRLADGVVHSQTRTGYTNLDLTIGFKILPGASLDADPSTPEKDPHHPIGDIYWDIAGLLNHYQAPAATGYDYDRTKYFFKNAVEDTYGLSPWKGMPGMPEDGKFLFKFSGSAYSVSVNIAWTQEAELAPGKNEGGWQRPTDQPRTVTFYPSEENKLNALLTLMGPGESTAESIYEMEAYVTLPRIGTSIPYSVSGVPQTPQENTELSLYLRNAAAVIADEGNLNPVITYTTGTPGIGAAYVAASEITDWSKVTGIKVYVDEMKVQKGINIRLDLRADTKDIIDVLTGYAGGGYRFKTSRGGSYPSEHPLNLQLCAWKYENTKITNGTNGGVFWDTYDENGTKGNTGEAFIKDVKLTLYTSNGKKISEAVTNASGAFTLQSYTAEAGQYIVIETPAAPEGETWTAKLTKKSASAPIQSAVDSDFDRETNKLVLGELNTNGVTNVSAGFVKLPQVSAEDVLVGIGTTADKNIPVPEFVTNTADDSVLTQYTVSLSGIDGTIATLVPADGDAFTLDKVDDANRQIPIRVTGVAAGEYEVTVTVTNSLGDEVSCTFTVRVGELTVSRADYEGVYDGAAHAGGDVTVTFNGTAVSPSDYTLEYSPDGNAWSDTDPTATHVADSTPAGEYLYVRAVSATYGTSAAASYRITITPATVTLASGSKTRQYNGSALTNAEVEGKNANGLTTETGWVGSEGAAYEFTGSQTNAGSTPNAFSYTLKEGTAAGDYTINKTEGTLTVTKAPLTITADSAGKEYDGTPLTDSGWQDTPPTGLQGTDAVESVTVTGTITDVGTEDNVPSGAAVKNGSADVTNNYEIGYVNGTLTVTASTKALVITSSTKSWIYDGQTHTDEVYTVTYGGSPVTADGTGRAFTLTTGDTVTVTATAAGVKDYDAGYSNNNTFSYELTNAEYYSSKSTVFGTLSIEKRAVTLSSESGEKPYDGFPLTKPDVTGWEQSGDTGFVTGEATGVKATGSVTHVSEGEVTNTIEYTPTANFKADNYAITKNEGKLKITQSERGLVITSSTKSWTYDGQTHTDEVYAVVYDGTDAAADETGRVFTLPTGDTVTITPTAAGVKDYDAAYSENNTYTYELTNAEDYKNVTENVGTLSIDKAPLTITAKPQTYTYSGEAQGPAGTYTEGFDSIVTVEGLQGSDALAGVTLTGSRTNADTYPEEIEPGAADVGAAADNYEIVYVKGDLTIQKAPLTITAKDQTYGYDGTAHGEDKATYTDAAEIDGKVTVTGLKGADALTEVTLDGRETDAGGYPGKIVPSAAVIGKLSSNSRAWSSPIDNYEVTYVPGTLTITKAPLTITADSAAKVYDGTPLTDSGWQDTPPVGLRGSDAVTGVTVTGSVTNAGTTKNVPGAAVVKNGGVDVTENYEIEYVNGTLTVTKAPLTVTAKDQSYTYNGKYQGEDDATYTSNLEAKVTVSGLVGSDKLTSVTLDGSEKDVGKYTGRISPSGAAVGAATGNYEITYVAGDLTIKAAKDDTPGTGDNTKIVLWSTLALISALGCGGALLLGRGKKRRTSK